MIHGFISLRTFRSSVLRGIFKTGGHTLSRRLLSRPASPASGTNKRTRDGETDARCLYLFSRLLFLEETRKNIQIQSPQTKNVLRPWWQEYKETTQAWISLNTAITAWFLCMQSLSQGEGIKATWGQVGTRVSQIQGCSLAISMSNPLQFQWTQNLFLYTTWQLNGDKVSQSFQRARDNKVSLELWWLAALQSSQPWAVPASEIPDLYWQSLGVLKSWIECRHQPYNNGIRTCQRDFMEALYCLAGCLLHTIIHCLAGFVSVENLQPGAHTKLWQAFSETADKIRWANTGTLHSALAVALGNILSHVYQDAVSRIESTSKNNSMQWKIPRSEQIQCCYLFDKSHMSHMLLFGYCLMTFLPTSVFRFMRTNWNRSRIASIWIEQLMLRCFKLWHKIRKHQHAPACSTSAALQKLHAWWSKRLGIILRHAVAAVHSCSKSWQSSSQNMQVQVSSKRRSLMSPGTFAWGVTAPLYDAKC